MDISLIDGMDGHDFEYFCADVLRNVGFIDVEVTRGSGDQGVDILAVKDGIKYAVQCKNYASSLGNTPVQEVSAGKQFYGCHVGVVMTNSTFTSGAVELAKATNVLLWDRNTMKELIEKAGGFSKFGFVDDNNQVGEFNHFKKMLDRDELEKKLDEILERNRDAVLNKINNRVIANNTEIITDKPRKGFYITGNICIAGSVIYTILIVFGLLTEDEITLMVGIGTTSLCTILGVMFRILAKSRRKYPYVTVCGKEIRKPVFIILSIVMAYICFLVPFLQIANI